MTDDIKTATDTLITAMEEVEEMDQVIVVFIRKDGHGIGWVTNMEYATERIGLLEFTKMATYQRVTQGD